MPNSPIGKHAYATLLTRPSYLAGAILLAFSLKQHSPSVPLIILYTPETLEEESVNAIRAESRHDNIILHPIEHLRVPPPAEGDVDSDDGEMVAERFKDTWTKLKVFEYGDLFCKFDRLCFLDSDMLVYKDPAHELFSPELGEYGLLATHVCVCNLDGDPWAPKSWTKENCAYTPQTTSSPYPPKVQSSPETHAILNSGTFVFRPSQAIHDLVLGTFHSMGKSQHGRKELKAMKFPDQDFINKVFHEKWSSLPWTVNALKTWRYWHPNIWVDDEVCVLHYIVDKPWAARVHRENDKLVAGYLRKDGETHKWWWNAYDAWYSARESQNEIEELETVAKYVAAADGEENLHLSAVGSKTQAFAKKWEDVDESRQYNDGYASKGPQHEDNSYEEGPNAPILRKHMLGERGHGPVVRGGRELGKGSHALNGRGRGYMEP